MTSFEAFTEICRYLLGKDFCIADPVDGDTARDIFVREIKKRYPAADESPVDKWRRKHKRCIWCIYCVPDQVFDPNSQMFETRYNCAAKCIKRIDYNMPRPFCTLFNLKKEKENGEC